MLDTTYLKKYIESLKRDRGAIDEQIREAERLLTIAEGGQKQQQEQAAAPAIPAPAAAGNGHHPPAFQVKYESNAETLIFTVVQQAAPRILNRGEISKLIEREGYQFHPHTYDMALHRLVKKSLVEKVTLRDSKFKFGWRLAKNKVATPPIDLTRLASSNEG
jgi:hypothetical protein